MRSTAVAKGHRDAERFGGDDEAESHSSPQAHSAGSTRARRGESEDPEATKARIKDTFEVLTQNTTTTTAMTVGARFTEPTFSTPASYHGGIVAPFGAGLAAGIALALNYESLRAIGRDGSAQETGTTRHHEASRERNITLGEAVQNASNMLGNTVNGIGGAMNLAGYLPEVFNAVLSAGGILALPAGVVQTGRFARKAAKARDRVNALRALMTAEDQDPMKALNAANEGVDAQRELVRVLEEASEAKETEFSQRFCELMDQPSAIESGQTILGVLMTVVAQADDLRSQLQEARAELRAAEERAAQRRTALQAMRQAIEQFAEEIRRPGRSDWITLRTIQAYAVKKNQRGWIKKIITSASGAFAAAGATASLVATIAIAAGATAGASVLLATPVGWGLVATATAAALGLGGYKAWKYFAKRWRWTAEHEADGEPSTLKRLGKTIAIWKKVGPSKREEYAAALYRMAKSGTAVLAEEARKTIAALGLDWYRLNMSDDPDSALKLIAAKLASSSTLPPA